MDQSRRSPRCCCRRVVPPVDRQVCEKVIGKACNFSKPCGKDGICWSKGKKCPYATCCQKFSSNDIFDTQSKMALEYGNTVYRNSTSGI